jgi:hypothetical protein
MKRLITVGLLLTALPLLAEHYQIQVFVPNSITDSLGNVIEQHSDPDSVLSAACALNPLMGQVTINNEQFTIFAYLDSTAADTALFNSLEQQFPDVDVTAVEVADE